eukprot:14199261-Alexandrium_andersonii.AAC.1
MTHRAASDPSLPPRRREEPARRGGMQGQRAPVSRVTFITSHLLVTFLLAVEPQGAADLLRMRCQLPAQRALTCTGGRAVTARWGLGRCQSPWRRC